MASTALNNRKELQKQIERLRKIGDGDEKGFEHDFLRVALYILKLDCAKGPKAATQIAEEAGSPSHILDKGVARLLIEAAVPDASDHNKSRWAVVLAHLVDRKVRSDRFNIFLANEGGVAGIYAKARKKHKMRKSVKKNAKKTKGSW